MTASPAPSVPYPLDLLSSLRWRRSDLLACSASRVCCTATTAPLPSPLPRSPSFPPVDAVPLAWLLPALLRVLWMHRWRCAGIGWLWLCYACGSPPCPPPLAALLPSGSSFLLLDDCSRLRPSLHHRSSLFGVSSPPPPVFYPLLVPCALPLPYPASCTPASPLGPLLSPLTRDRLLLCYPVQVWLAWFLLFCRFLFLYSFAWYSSLPRLF